MQPEPSAYLMGGASRTPRIATFLLAIPALGLVAGLIFLPTIGLFVLSLAENFNPGDPVDKFFKGNFGWANYVRLVTDEFVIGRLLRTLAIGAIVTLATIVVGVPLAMALWRMNGRAKALLLALTLTPLLVSIVVSAYGWSVLLGQSGIVNETLRSLGLISRPLKLMHSDIAIVIGLVHILLPFMVLNLLAALERVPRVVLEAASTLGASPLRVHAAITLPLAAAGIRSGVLLVFSLAVAAFVTPAILGGNGTPVFPMVIYEQFSGSFQWAYGAALAIALLVISSVIVALYLATARRVTY
jgi:putative spermidine/putrescine transport system permease protein